MNDPFELRVLRRSRTAFQWQVVSLEGEVIYQGVEDSVLEARVAGEAVLKGLLEQAQKKRRR
jgi:hypothetical protein